MPKSILREAGRWFLPWLIGVCLLTLAVRPGRAAPPTDAATAAADLLAERPNLYDLTEVPRHQRKILFRAAGYAKRGQVEEAAALLAGHLRDHPDQDGPLLRLHLAQNLADLGRMTEAGDHYRRAVELEPRLDRAWFGLADAAYELKEYALAGEAFAQGYEVSPERPTEVLYYAAAAYLLAEQPAAALPFFQRLTSGRFGTIEAKWVQGLLAAASRLEQPDLAAEGVQRLLKAMSDDPEAWILKYQFEASRRDFRAAAVALRVVGFLRPLSATEQKQLGDLLLIVGVPELASRHYREGMSSAGTSAEFERLASALVAAHETEEALLVLEAALQVDPTTRLWSLLGDIHYLRQEYAEALAAFQRVNAEGDETGRAVLMQGYCALELGRCDEALDLLARASTFPDQEEMAQRLIQRALHLKEG